MRASYGDIPEPVVGRFIRTGAVCQLCGSNIIYERSTPFPERDVRDRAHGSCARRLYDGDIDEEGE